MFNARSLIYLSTLIFDKENKTIGFCKTCKKSLKTYRQVRYHFQVVHRMEKSELKKINKAARLLELEKK